MDTTIVATAGVSHARPPGAGAVSGVVPVRALGVGAPRLTWAGMLSSMAGYDVFLQAITHRPNG